MSFLRPAKFFLGLSALLSITGAVILFVPGPKLSIDFTGGTLMEIALAENVTKDDVAIAMRSLDMDPPLGTVAVNITRDGTALLRMRDISNEEHINILSALENMLEGIEERQFTTIGPTVGASLRQRSLWALGLAAIAIVLYIAFAFRKVPRRLSAWRFGIIAVVTLLHDVLVTVGIFVILSHITSFEFDTLFITALLTIIGYSVNDTIVIFDRIRDNLFLLDTREPFADTAERSLQQSIRRSINTSVSTLIMLFALFFLGSESIKWFVLTLITGATIGTYSSIFLATPLLVYWRKRNV